jgi:hypothetical protein
MDKRTGEQFSGGTPLSDVVFWRVEGSLLNLTAVRPVAFLTWNAQSFAERWARRGGVALSALVRPLLYAANRIFATRVLHMLLRGVSQDRLDLLGEEYFEYLLKPRLKSQGVEKLKEAMAAGGRVILVSQGLDHVMRPLARYLGAEHYLANRLEFRDGLATGRLLEPVIRPRGGLARITGQKADGRVSLEQLTRDLGIAGQPEVFQPAILPSKRPFVRHPTALFLDDSRRQVQRLSVRESLAGKHILLIGATGFIGKVWLIKVLNDLPEIGKLYLLIRPQRSASAVRRFEKMVAQSPAFDALCERHGSDLGNFLVERIEVVEGDVCKPGLGLKPEVLERLSRTLDLVVNSSGITDFTPDLPAALEGNVDATVHLLDFIRHSDHAGLLHLSTCYVAGCRDGRIVEELRPNYAPNGAPGFEAKGEYQNLHTLIRQVESLAETAKVTEELRQQALAKGAEAGDCTEEALEARIRKYRPRWIRNQTVEAGMQRARELGWPNTYTLTKSLAESFIARLGSDHASW